MSIAEIINQNNEDINKLYPSGENHRGKKLQFYTVQGYEIFAITKGQAEGIYHWATIDAE